MDTYTAFIRNVKRADEAIRIARQTKPAFDRFLQVRVRARDGLSPSSIVTSWNVIRSRSALENC